MFSMWIPLVSQRQKKNPQTQCSKCFARTFLCEAWWWLIAIAETRCPYSMFVIIRVNWRVVLDGTHLPNFVITQRYGPHKYKATQIAGMPEIWTRMFGRFLSYASPNRRSNIITPLMQEIFWQHSQSRVDFAVTLTAAHYITHIVIVKIVSPNWRFCVLSEFTALNYLPLFNSSSSEIKANKRHKPLKSDEPCSQLEIAVGWC
jgi:hypothetical protein